MKITTTTHHELTFTIEAFWAEEGGLGHEVFGSTVKTLEEAITLLGLARASTATQTQNDTNDWKIVIEVETKTTRA